MTLKAYLENLDIIHLYIKNSYYDGVTKVVKLKHGKDKQDLEIIETIKEEEYTKYIVKLSESIDFSKEYEILDDHGLRTPLVYKGVINSKEFNEMYFYNCDDLGNTYTKDTTTFKVWAPTAVKVLLSYELNNEVTVLPMTRGEKGVWSIFVAGDLELAKYNYLVKVNGSWNEATDPYAYTSTPNHKQSVVIDLEKTKIDLKSNCLPKFKSPTDAVIYELHVRDFSVANPNIKEKGKFLGVVSEVGLNYLKSLNITHLQLLPIYDFGSVDEENQFDFYNWGYDPVQYNVPEGSYATNVYDPYSRIVDLKTMVSKLHEANIRVNMDVVYNHMFDMGTSAFQQIVPNYYFRFGANGEVSNGSFCGNDVESRNLMVRKYIVDSVKHWVNFYGIDGFRFDLMGILDTITMNQIREELTKINPEIMVYGEGWNMPTLISFEERSCMQNHVNVPELGHFNDRFRNKVTEFVMQQKHLTDTIMHVMMGSLNDYKKEDKLFNEPHQSVNYVECHDNETFYDKLLNFNDTECDDIRKYRARLAESIIFISQGISFIHAGEEFFRTKDRDHNSYMSPDSINKFDWERLEENASDVEFVKGLINLRRSHKAFRFDTAAEVNEHVKVRKIKANVIEYSISKVKKYGPYGTIKAYVNATNEEIKIPLRSEYKVFIHDQQASSEPLFTVEKEVIVKPLSVTLLMK